MKPEQPEPLLPRVKLIPMQSTWTCPKCNHQNVYREGIVSDPQNKCSVCETEVTIGAIRSTDAEQEPLPPPERKLYSRLIQLASALVQGREFISPYAEDNPKSTPQSILIQAEAQRERLRLWAIETREIADALIARADRPAPVVGEQEMPANPDPSSLKAYRRTEPDPAARIAEMEQKEFTQEMWNLTQSEVGALQSQVEQLREALQLIANSFDTRPIVEVKKIARAALDAIRQQDTEKGEK